MKRPLALSLTLALAAVLVVAACQTGAPSFTSPAASAAFNQTRAIKALDLIRDTAIAAHEEDLLSTETTRQIVHYHRASIILVHGSPSDWRGAVLFNLERLLAELPAADREFIGPYAALIRSIAAEVSR